MANDNNMPSGARELAEFAHSLGLDNRILKPLHLARPGEEDSTTPLAIIPKGMTIADLRPYLPTAPTSKQGMVKFTSVASFIAFVNEQKNPDNTRIFASIDKAPYTFTARIDWHGTAGQPAGWNNFGASLELRPDSSFSTWHAINDQLMKQELFAEFLKDNRTDIVFPSGADILNMVMALEVTTTAKCTGKTPTNAGMTLHFSEERTTNVVIPDHIDLELPLFVGSQPIPIKAEFKIRSGQEKGILFGIRMLAIKRAIEAAVDSIAKDIANATNLPVYQ